MIGFAQDKLNWRINTMALYFENPDNGYIERSGAPWLWSFVFGSFYFLYKRAYGWFGISFLLACFTLGLSWLVIPFFAKGIIRKNYLQRGWKNKEKLTVSH